MKDVDVLRRKIIRASLHLAATEWDNGRSSADESMSLDWAWDMFDEALMDYVSAVTA